MKLHLALKKPGSEQINFVIVLKRWLADWYCKVYDFMQKIMFLLKKCKVHTKHVHEYS